MARLTALTTVASCRDHDNRSHRLPSATKFGVAGLLRSTFENRMTPGTKNTIVLSHTKTKLMMVMSRAAWIPVARQFAIELATRLMVATSCSGIQNLIVVRSRICASEVGTSSNHLGITKHAS